MWRWHRASTERRGGGRALALLLLIAASPAAVAAELRVADLKIRQAAGDPPVLVDVRTPAEFAEGHVPGATNIPLDQLEQRLDELSAYRDAEVVVYCRAGPRALAAVELLEARGFSRVLHLAGDMNAWEAAAAAVAPQAENAESR